MATVEDVIGELRAAAKENTAKTYRRHGATGEVLGVSYSVLNPLAKRLKVDHALALGLWRTGIHEAQVLATKVADPEHLSHAEIETWLAQAGDYVITDALSALAARSPQAPDWARRWIDSPQEWTSAAGWNVVGLLAMDGRLPADEARPLLQRITRHLHSAPNRTRHSMNGALISLGGSLPELTEAALQAAKAIGPVEVDHGETGCKTPDATAYIRKMTERQRKAASPKSAKPAQGSSRATGGKKARTSTTKRT
jgi:3-methyladenine DNA glycosylase AlkD